MKHSFDIGEVVQINNNIAALDKYGQRIRSGELIDAYSRGVIVGYKDKYTEKLDDDLAKIKITKGDHNLIGKEVWVKAGDFKKIDKLY